MKPQSKEKLVNKVPIHIIQRKFIHKGKVQVCKHDKSSKSVSRVKVPAPGGKVILSPEKVPNEDERVPPHGLWMNKFTVLAYCPFIPDPPEDYDCLAVPEAP